MIHGALVAVAVLGTCLAAAQAIEQLAPPVTPAQATRADQAAPIADAPTSVRQLPATSRAKRPIRLIPTRDAPPDPVQTDLARAAATVVARGQPASPELLVREVGPDTLAELAGGARTADPARPGADGSTSAAAAAAVLNGGRK